MNAIVVGWAYSDDQYGQDGLWVEASESDIDATVEKLVADCWGDDDYDGDCDYVVTRLADVAEMGAAEWCDFSAQWALARKRGWVSERADRLIMDEMRRRDADDESED